MAQIYFHCSTAEGILIDRSGAALGDLAEARDHAALVVQSTPIGPRLTTCGGPARSGTPSMLQASRRLPSPGDCRPAARSKCARNCG
jgi:hypothetical protein